MAERSQSFHWVTPESVPLCKCWSHVSMEYGGPGIYQLLPQLWNKITDRYHSSNPSIPRDKNMNTGAPRKKSALLNKWNRMGPFISSFIKHYAFATANHRSGENAEDDVRRAVKAYNDEHKTPWAYMKEWEVLATYPKWMLDTIGITEQANRRAGIHLATPLKERLARIAETSLTVANTDKPQGVKKARQTLKAIRDTEKEMEAEEKRMAAYIENFSHQAEVSFRHDEQCAKRTAMFESTSDDLVLMTDTSRMPPEVFRVFSGRLKVAMDNTLARCKLHEEKVAAVAIAEAEAAEVAAARERAEARAIEAPAASEIPEGEVARSEDSADSHATELHTGSGQ